MKRIRLSKFCAPMLMCGVLFAASSASAQEQEVRIYQEGQKYTETVKLDEYGQRLGHCAWTARLDNLAVFLQSEPSAKGYLIGHNPAQSKVDYAAWQLKNAFFYLTHQRGLSSEQIVLINAGPGTGQEATTELWVVPEGALPPVQPPADSLGAGKEFSGKLDVYATSESVFREQVEMGWASYEVTFHDFAEKLRRQPDSQGYLVVRPAKNSPPGAWRRIARRDEFILQNDYEVAPGRVKSVNGGASDTDSAQVELWLLPKSAPPPAGVEEKAGAKLTEAFKLNSLEIYGAPDKGESEWALENLAEQLRADAKARGFLIVRQHTPEEEDAADEGEQAAGEESKAAAEANKAETAKPEAATQEKANQDNAGNTNATGEPSQQGEEQAGDEAESVDVLTLAEEWKKTLAEKYGIEPHRVVVLVGHPRDWAGELIDTWVVPADAAPPDPFVVTKDEEPEEVPSEDESEPEDVSLLVRARGQAVVMYNRRS